MLWKCGEQYRRRYVMGEIIPPNTNMVIGTAGHKSIEVNLNEKIKSGLLLPLSMVTDAARDGLNSAWNQGVMLDADEKIVGVKATKNEAINMAVSLAELHYNELAPIINPVCLERKFELSIKEHGYELTGRIDIEGVDFLRDTKTSSLKKSGAAQVSGQLTMYGLARRVEGRPVKKFYLDTLLKTKVPAVDLQETTRDEEDYAAFMRRIKSAIGQIEAGMFPPSNTDNWWCSPKWCGYWATCPYVNGRKKEMSI